MPRIKLIGSLIIFVFFAIGISQPVSAQDVVPSIIDDATRPTADHRIVEEGDIFRIIRDDLLLHLNSLRGLQAIDFSDVENPEIIGRLQITGSPVEMYVVGDTAYVLLNNWRGYYSPRSDLGQVLSVDISDPTNPIITDQADIPGRIRASRLTRNGGISSLYVVGSADGLLPTDNGTTSWASKPYALSFDISDTFLTRRSQLNLEGYTADIQMTPEVLLVGLNNRNWDDSQSQVAVVDISDPSGVMVMGDQVTVDGWINNQFNMDFYNGVLRVVSGSRWGSDRANWVQTFDASDLNNITPIDTDAFGFNEDLYATLFLGNKAFFQTYRRLEDPFHAYEITDDGMIVESSEFIMSGWNHFFRATFNDSRLIGIGVNKASNRTMSVCLFDTDLTNPVPLLARSDVGFEGSWSEARWDHRAFSVLENAVEIEEPPDGVVETGLVLLPFSGWNEGWEEYTPATQIFTFSENSLTRRGLMPSDTPVQRTFLIDDDIAANLSDSELRLFDLAEPDAPQELGRVELAPHFSDVFIFGRYRARVKRSGAVRDLIDGSAELPPATVELVPASQHPDFGSAVASFEIPSDATVYQSGDLLVTAEFEILDSSDWPYSYETTIDIWDLGEPTTPERRGQITTERLRPVFPSGRIDKNENVESVPGGLIFLEKRGRRYALEVLDLTNPDTPTLAESIDLGIGKKRISMLVDGSDAWISYQRRPRVRYFVQPVDLASLSSPQLGDPINVPGELLAVDGDTIFTRDTVWGEEIVETAIAKLVVAEGLAYLQAMRRFENQIVEDIALDNVGHVVVSHRLAKQYQPDVPAQHYLTVLDVQDNLEVLATVPVATRAELEVALPGRELFKVPGGLFVFNLDDAEAPYPQAYFPTLGWPSEILVDGRDILFVAGRYGIYEFDLDEFNLLPLF